MRPLVAATLALLAAGPASARAADPPALRAKLVSCQTGALAADRFAVYTGSMPAMPGAVRMEMRFDLLQRHAGTLGYARVPLPKWGQWERTERRAIAGFIFTKRVEQLAAPATYRALVRFRWFDAGGDLVRSARRESGPCHQQDPRPDLEIGSLSAAPDGRYLVEIINDGLTDSGPFSMALGSVTTQVTELSAGQRRLIAIAADRCGPGDQVSIALDTGDDVEEAD